MLGITILAVKLEKNEGSTVDPARGVGQGFSQALGDTEIAWASLAPGLLV